MKAKDLRINDIVLYHSEPCYVIGISDSFTKIQFPDKSEMTALTEELEPCEIFEKYLKTNHFFLYKENCYVKSIASMDHYDNRRLKLGLCANCASVYLENNTGYGNLSVFIANIRYMHELQHIMAIFGKDMTL